MIRKVLKYVIGIIVIIFLLMLTLAFRPDFKNKDNTKDNENKTIEEQVVDTLSIDKTDKNIIGYITIEELGIIKAPIADGTDNKTIGKYVGHFENSSYLEGNVCLCSHNRGSKAAFFENLKNIKKGMKIEYTTKYETKTYITDEIKEIEETDFSVLEPTKDNRITLITCIANQRAKRLCVIGIGE
ncbi:MAG: class D sortase [Clostridia bacterium]|jgi:sortase family protein|nr:class D sortase [Clostridium sp.]